MTPPELDRVADLMRSVAEEAILPRYRQLAEGDVRESGLQGGQPDHRRHHGLGRR